MALLHGNRTLNAADWESCSDAVEMLKYIGGRGLERKLRLLGCFFCRCVWDLLTHPASRKAVEIAERSVDHLAELPELESAWESSWAVHESLDGQPRTLGIMAAWVAAMTCHRLPWGMGQAVTEAIRIASIQGGERTRTEREALPDLVRDIFPNPFRLTLIAPSVLHRTDGLVLETARVIYSERRFEHMPLLADALERASCANAHVIDHCRRGSQHARGCWVLDKLLRFPDVALTEAEWNASDDAKELLHFIRPRANDRELRLFACACGRLAWSEMADAHSRKAIEVGEKLANGVASDQDARRLLEKINDWDAQHPPSYEWSDCYGSSILVADELSSHPIARAVLHADAWKAAVEATIYTPKGLRRLACDALRGIFPYP